MSIQHAFFTVSSNRTLEGVILAQHNFLFKKTTADTNTFITKESDHTYPAIYAQTLFNLPLFG